MCIGEVCLQTNDVIALASFYQKLFMLGEVSDDPVHQFILHGETALTLYNDGTIKNNLNQNISLAFTVEDVDAEYERLLQMGVAIIDKPTLRPWGAKNMHLSDPDGNHIYLRSFPKE
ncbi:MAG: VOC family protein [Clostridiales bacterium]|nr:VOC family protein [Clostridiales bacterium]